MIIAHVCNEVGVWVGEDAKAIASRWPQVRSAYYRWYRNRIRNDFTAGAVQFVEHFQRHRNHKTRIANMIAQPDHRRSVRFRSFEKCLLHVSRKAKKMEATVHMPKIGPDQTESWFELEAIILRMLCSSQINVFVYIPKSQQKKKWFNDEKTSPPLPMDHSSL